MYTTQQEASIVSIRADLVLRFAEIQLCFRDVWYVYRGSMVKRSFHFTSGIFLFSLLVLLCFFTCHRELVSFFLSPVTKYLFHFFYLLLDRSCFSYTFTSFIFYKLFFKIFPYYIFALLFRQCKCRRGDLYNMG